MEALMKNDAICELCRSIPLFDIPSSFHQATEFGKLKSEPPLNFWIAKPEDGRSLKDEYTFHQSITDLEVSAGVCQLCRIIRNEVKISLHTYNKYYRTEWFVGKFQTHSLDGRLKIVRRIDEGSGFAVVTEISGYEPLTFVALANLSTFVPYDSPYANDIVGRPIGKATVCDESMKWASTCIEACISGHPKCSNLPGLLPKRILDLKDVTTRNVIRLIEAAGVHERYATLSYCWGRGSFFTLKSGTMEQLKSGIELPELPQTLRDVIGVTQRLGLRYLWIDALCIVQDDRDDWAEQSTHMADVYGQAWITIAAQDSASADEGCAYPLPDKFSDQVSVYPHHFSEGVKVFVTDAKDFRPRNLSQTTLISRGWTFQERVLSRRVLFLCKTELKFECRDMFLTEHGHRDLSTQVQRSLGMDDETTKLEMNDVSTQVKAWIDLVGEYNGRALTHMTDKFPALAGVASQFQKHTNARYVAGIWSNAILESMLFAWAGGRDFGSEEEFYRTYTAPSWSWAAHYGGVGINYNHVEDMIAEVVDWNVVLRTSNPFGEVSSAWLKVKAPLLPLRQRVNPNRSDAATGKAMHFDVGVDYPIAAGDARVDLRIHRRTNPGTDPGTIKLFVLVLCWRGNFPGSNFEIVIPEGKQIVTGIVVTPAGPQQTEMHRVGKLNLWGDALRGWYRLIDNTTFSEVVLV